MIGEEHKSVFLRSDNKFIVFIKMEQTVSVLQGELMHPLKQDGPLHCPCSPSGNIDEIVKRQNII